MSIAHRCLSHSQWREDVQLWPVLSCAAHMGMRRTAGVGTFVELGAFDGVTHSNTFLLEKCHGWSGLLIEASPANFARLQSSGRTAVMLHSAVCDATTRHLDISADSGEFGGETGLMQAANFHKFEKRANLTTTARVPCSPLRHLMASNGMHAATWLSLDVEGAEAKVLQTVDPAVFKIIMVETFQPLFGKKKTREDEEHNERVAALIVRGGFARVPALGNRVNHVYIRHDVLRHCNTSHLPLLSGDL